MSARLGVDVGGTFTDLVALESDGAIRVRKVLSTPDDPSKGVLAVLETLKGAVLVHGTTVATNALLERHGARVVFVTTAGFEDLLWLRRQDRAALYDLGRDHPPPLVARDAVVGVRERMGPDGVVTPLQDQEVERVVAAVRAAQPQAVAVALLFAFRHPSHERRLADALARALPNITVVTSHEVLPVFREYERFATTSAEAFLRPRVGEYVTRLGAALKGRMPLRVMTSAGGSLAPEIAARHAAALALSGPAGGVVGAALAGAAAGERNLLTLDMGGTSADAGLVLDGSPLTETANAVGGVPLALPAVLVETVSAGGGSVAWVDEGGALRVGPRSAGAVPGPACYGRGGTEPTVTDACLVLGWLDPDRPLAAGVTLDRAAAERALAPLARAVGRDGCGAAAGVVAVAAATMARALKRVSVARGVDPRGMTLVPFGGAGPLFGCALADALGMSRVLVPPHPGALSALGLAAAAERVERTASVHRQLESSTPGRGPGVRPPGPSLEELFRPLVAEVSAELPGATVTRFADCRFVGQGYEVTVPAPKDDAAAVRAAFLAAHRSRFGHAEDSEAVELVNVRVVAQRAAPSAASPSAAARGGLTPGRRPGVNRTLVVHGAQVSATVWPLDDLPPGTHVRGPGVLAGGDATALVEPGWGGVVHASGALVLVREGPA